MDDFSRLDGAGYLPGQPVGFTTYACLSESERVEKECTTAK